MLYEVITRSQIYEPDYVIVQDPTLMDSVDVTSGLKKGGKILINTLKDIELEGYDVKTIDATGIALDVLGVPIVNTVLCGAFAGITGEVTIES